MSSNIWMQCAGASRIRTLRGAPWRAVEAQHQISTRKLVDSLEEQALLEQLIDASKPPDRTGGRLHVLLATPFRYPPLPHGSRFGGRHEPGIWYGSDSRHALFAEVAYYRFVFLEGTRADLGTLTTAHTAFRVSVRTSKGVDLSRAPFDAHREAIASPTDYAASQALGTAMRDAGVHAIRYHSARDAEGGTNVAVFSPAAFGAAEPRDLETWHSAATRARVELVRHDYFSPLAFAFDRDAFLVDGRLPAPAL
jgi:hypothetical protein